MKLNFRPTTFVVAALIAIGILFVVACSKDILSSNKKTECLESTNVECDGKSIITDDQLSNKGSSVNPYDEHGYLIINLFNKLGTYISNSGDLSYEQVQLYASALLDSINPYYPTLSEKKIESLDTTILQSVVRQILSSEEDNIFDVAQQAELFVLESAMDLDAKDAFLQIISELKFCMMAYARTENQKPGNTASNQHNPNTYEQRVDNCISYETSQIFEHGSWLKQAIFIAGLPESFITIAVECMTIAATNPDDPRMF